MAKRSGFNADVIEVTPKECISILRDIMKCEENIPVYIEGKPGLGKTSIVQQVSIENKHEIYEYLLSCVEPTDVTGIPAINPDGYFRYSPEERFYLASTKIGDGPPTTLFFDDLPVAAQQVQAAFYKLVHERSAGPLKLRDNTHICAAGNRVEDNAAANEMPTALANRFVFMYLKEDHESWIDWAVGEGIHPSVVAYLRKMPSRLMVFNPDSQEKAFASPRSWHMISRLMWHMERLRKKLDPRVMAGTIGQGLAIEFDAFLDSSRSAVPIADIVADPKRAKIPTERQIDALYATICNLEHHLGSQDHADDWKPIAVYSARTDMQDELGLVLANKVVNVILNGLKGDKKTKAVISNEIKSLKKKYGKHLTRGNF